MQPADHIENQPQPEQDINLWWLLILLVMALSSEGRVGSKGELFPPKQIRERTGLTPSRKILFRIEEDKLIVEPIRSLEELMDETPNVEISMAEFKADRRELSKKAES